MYGIVRLTLIVADCDSESNYDVYMKKIMCYANNIFKNKPRKYINHMR